MGIACFERCRGGGLGLCVANACSSSRLDTSLLLRAKKSLSKDCSIENRECDAPIFEGAQRRRHGASR